MRNFIQTITLADLVAVNRKAIADRTLGAFNHAACYYRYKDTKGKPTGEGCSIGVALNDEAAQEVEALAYNSAGFDMLVRRNILEVTGHPAAYDLAMNMQRLHDAWAKHEGVFAKLTRPDLIPQAIKSFLDDLSSLLGPPKHIDQTIFEDYLAMIEAELANPTVTEGEASQ